MPKMKTRKAVASRFKVTGTGKLVRHKQGLSHLMTKKSKKRKLQGKNPVLVKTALSAKYKRMMGK